MLLYGEEGWSGSTVSTVLLVSVPLVLVNLISAAWYHQDHRVARAGFCPVRSRFESCERTVLVLSHVLLLGPLVRQVHIIWCGVRDDLI